MALTQVYSDKDPGELIGLAWDFGALLGTAETIQTATWVITDPEDAVADMSNMLPEGPSIDGVFVRQRIQNGVDGQVYKYRITITTNLGAVYIEKPTQLVTSE